VRQISEITKPPLPLKVVNLGKNERRKASLISPLTRLITPRRVNRDRAQGPQPIAGAVPLLARLMQVPLAPVASLAGACVVPQASAFQFRASARPRLQQASHLAEVCTFCTFPSCHLPRLARGWSGHFSFERGRQ